jgi:hypothetical protein
MNEGSEINSIYICEMEERTPQQHFTGNHSAAKPK